MTFVFKFLVVGSITACQLREDPWCTGTESRLFGRHVTGNVFHVDFLENKIADLMKTFLQVNDKTKVMRSPLHW